MKRFLFNLFFAAIAVAIAAGCTTTATVDGKVVQLTPAQKCTADMNSAVGSVDQITLLATSAIKRDVLKGGDADTTVAAVKAARDGLKVADDMSKTDPAGCSNKVGWTMGIFAATQTYLATKGVK